MFRGTNLQSLTQIKKRNMVQHRYKQQQQIMCFGSDATSTAINSFLVNLARERQILHLSKYWPTAF